MATNESPILAVDEVIRRLTVDHGLLADLVEDLTPDELDAPYRVQGGPLGDFCESLRDLMAHLSMWDEINLAVLAEAHRGRRHWSLAPRWEEPESGRLLNRSGVAAGRELPAELLSHRFATAHAALLDEVSRYGDEAWTAPLSPPPSGHGSIGALAQHAMSVPGNAAYWHAAVHLGKLAEVGA